MPLMDRKKNSSLPQGEHRQRLDELHFMMAEEVLQTNLEKISDPKLRVARAPSRGPPQTPSSAGGR